MAARGSGSIATTMDRLVPGSQLYRLAWQTSAPQAGGLGLLVAVSALAPVAALVMVAEMLTGGGSTPAGSVLVLVLLLGGRALQPLQDELQDRLGSRMDRELVRSTLGAVASSAGLGPFLSDDHLRGLLRQARERGPFDAAFACRAAGGVLSARLRAVGLVAVLASYIIWLPALFLPAWFAARHWLREQGHDWQRTAYDRPGELRRRDGLLRLLLGSAGARELRTFGRIQDVVGDARQVWSQGSAQLGDGSRRTQRALLLSTGAVVAAVAGSWAALAGAAAQGGLSPEAAVVGAIATVWLPEGLWAGDDETWTARASAPLVAADRLRRAVESLPQPPDEPDGAAAVAVRLTGAGFRYPAAEREALSNIDLTIPTGTSLAIVGANGSGKTTLVRLLLGELAPTTGRREASLGIDGSPSVAAVFQEPVALPFSLADNVCLGRAASEAALTDVAQRSGLAGVVADRGWDVQLDGGSSAGQDLSGGEWQRVSLARALLALDQGAELLVLDEPTANLDPESERKLFTEVLSAARDRGASVVLASHHYWTVEAADHIVVVDAGRITEHGTHAELLAADGVYARLSALQQAELADAGTDGSRPSGGSR